MQLSEEEKQALKEKYKQQRRAMWSGKRSSGTSAKSAVDEAEQSGVETGKQNRHATDHQDDRPHIVSSILPAEPDCDSSSIAQLGANAEFADNAYPPDESESQPMSQRSKTGDADSRQVNSVAQIATAVSEPASETVQLVEKIRKQRNVMREEQASILARPQKRRRNGETEERISPIESKEEGEPKMMTWKLILGVIGSIIVLMAIGMMLGIWFANQ